MTQFVNIAVVFPKKIDLMLKDVCDLHDASNRRSEKNSFSV